MDTVELEVFGEPGWTRDWVTSTLHSAGFRVTWRNELLGFAARGDRIDGWLLGARAPWLRLSLRLLPGGSGQTAVRLERIGPEATPRRNWDRAMAEVRNRLEAAFLQTGTLASTAG